MKFIDVRGILEQLVALGVVDGVVKRLELSVDGFPLATIESIVEKLSEI